MTCPKHRGRITRERDATLERFSIKEKKMANDNHLLSVTCYNVTMLNTNYYNEFFELGFVLDPALQKGQWKEFTL